MSIKPFLPTPLVLWAILAMTLLLERNIERAEKAAIKLIFNKSPLITFLCVLVLVVDGAKQDGIRGFLIQQLVAR